MVGGWHRYWTWGDLESKNKYFPPTMDEAPFKLFYYGHFTSHTMGFGSPRGYLYPETRSLLVTTGQGSSNSLSSFFIKESVPVRRSPPFSSHDDNNN